MKKDGTDKLFGKKPSTKHVSFNSCMADKPERLKAKQRIQAIKGTTTEMEVQERLKEDEAGAIVWQAYAPRRTRLRIVQDLPRYRQSNSKYGIDAALQKYTEVLPPFVLRQNKLDKKQLVTLRGPGCYTKAYTSFVNKAKPCSIRCSLSTLVPRFKTHMQAHPGPGTYFPEVFPVVPKPNSGADRARFQPMSRNPRGNSTVFSIIGKDSVGPGGVYNLVSPIDKYLAEKRFGLIDFHKAARGQHIGTMERIRRKTRTGPGMYNIPIHESSLSHWTKTIVGRMLKAARFFPERQFLRHGRDCLVFSENNCTPGPYDIRQVPRPKNIKAVPFNQSTSREGPLICYNSSVPPCRYYPNTFHDSRHVNGHSNIFKSKIQRFPELQSHTKSSKKNLENANVRNIVAELYGSAQAKKNWEDEDKTCREMRISDTTRRDYYYRRK